MKFIRRKDLDAITRLEIIKAGFKGAGIYGAMTKLALQYSVSRTFLYQLMALGLMYLTEMLDVESREIKSPQMDIEPLIVLLRLEGKCSIGSISEILKTLNYPHSSEGMISQLLKKYGNILPSTLSTSGEHLVIFIAKKFSH